MAEWVYSMSICIVLFIMLVVEIGICIILADVLRRMEGEADGRKYAYDNIRDGAGLD